MFEIDEQNQYRLGVCLIAFEHLNRFWVRYAYGADIHGLAMVRFGYGTVWVWV